MYPFDSLIVMISLWVRLGTITLDNKIKILSSNEEYVKFNITKTICEAYLVT